MADSLLIGETGLVNGITYTKRTRKLFDAHANRLRTKEQG